MSISQRLKQLREREGLTETELANIFKVDRKTIWRAETEQYTPKTELIILYAKYFNISADYLLCLTQVPKKLSEETHQTNKNINITNKGGNNKINIKN